MGHKQPVPSTAGHMRDEPVEQWLRREMPERRQHKDATS